MKCDDNAPFWGNWIITVNFSSNKWDTSLWEKEWPFLTTLKPFKLAGKTKATLLGNKVWYITKPPFYGKAVIWPYKSHYWNSNTLTLISSNISSRKTYLTVCSKQQPFFLSKQTLLTSFKRENWFGNCLGEDFHIDAFSMFEVNKLQPKHVLHF